MINTLSLTKLTCFFVKTSLRNGLAFSSQLKEELSTWPKVTKGLGLTYSRTEILLSWSGRLLQNQCQFSETLTGGIESSLRQREMSLDASVLRSSPRTVNLGWSNLTGISCRLKVLMERRWTGILRGQSGRIRVPVGCLIACSGIPLRSSNGLTQTLSLQALQACESTNHMLVWLKKEGKSVATGSI